VTAVQRGPGIPRFAPEPAPLGPMLQPGTITTLVGPVNDELAALTAALAVSYKTGCPLIPGFVPDGPSEVKVYCYEATWISWTSLEAGICAAAGIRPAPVMHLECLSEPLVQHLAAERDPDARSYWNPYHEAIVDADIAAAKAAGRQLPPILTIVYGVTEAAGDWGDEAMRQLYNRFQGMTVLMAGLETAEEMARSYGPVIELPDLHNSVRWRDRLAAVTGGDRDHSSRQPDLAPAADSVVVRYVVDGEEVPEMLGAARAFFVVEGTEALRSVLDDGDSPTTRELKARAKAQGISSGRLWVAAKRIARDAAARPHGEPGTLIGHAAVFNQWQEINRPLQGHYLERITPGAFTKALTESRQRMKCTYRHGKDPELGFRSLGPITVLEEDEFGVYYEVQLVDADYTRTLVPGLQAGLYRSSFTFEVLNRDLVKEPGESAHNPDGLPELTIREVRCSELGPCPNPAYAGTCAGIRLGR
jgi:HK97 family phage prohead protease